MNSGGPPANGGLGGPDGATNGTHGISTEAAVAALEQHDTLFHRQVMHLRQQQVGLLHSPGAFSDQPPSAASMSPASSAGVAI